MGGGIRFEFGGGFGGFQQQRQQPQRETNDLYQNGSRVTNITKSAWDNDVLTDDKFVWVVEFYAPWCPHCKALKTEYESVAKNLDGIMKVVAVNCEKEKAICQSVGVEAYPTLTVIAEGQVLKQYGGQKVSATMTKWALENLPNHVRTVRDAAGLKALYRECEKSQWKVCVVFQSGRADPSPQAKTLAYRFRNNTVVAEVKTSQEDVMKELMATGAGVTAVCGAGDRLVPYVSDKFTAGRIQNWMVSFATGIKCMEGMRIEHGSDLGYLKRSQLDSLVEYLGKRCVACYDKSEYEKMIYAAMTEKGMSHLEL